MPFLVGILCMTLNSALYTNSEIDQKILTYLTRPFTEKVWSLLYRQLVHTQLGWIFLCTKH